MEGVPTFGQVLRERRTADGLTQAELAHQVSCAAVTIRKIEADALRPSVQLAKLLAGALTIPAHEIQPFVRLARRETAPTPLPMPSPNPAEIGQEDLSGRAVKGFLLAERIGSGGFGVVYRAVQPSVQRDVAIKIILPQFANHPDFIRSFEAEAHLVARLEHPHIVPLYDYWRDPDAAYLIMRLLPGGNLDSILGNGPLPAAQCRRIVHQIGQALASAHAYGVVHRDIKPANVLIDAEQNAYLSDFGIARDVKFADQDGYTDLNNPSSPAYLSPEQILHQPISPASDVYCFGVMLFEMLTGRKPFPGPTPQDFVKQQINDPVPSLLEFDPSLAPALDALIQRILAKDPAARFQDMVTLLQAFNDALDNGNGASILIDDAAAPPLNPLSSETSKVGNPFRGLRPFGEEDASNFYGRRRFVEKMVSLLSDGSDLKRFLAIGGPSGSGKSSVVKAGLVPALRQGALAGSDCWFIVDMVPGRRPWSQLAQALQRVAVDPPADLVGLLKADERGLLRVAHHILPDDDETKLLIIVDQFEEIFTLVEDEAVRVRFLDALVTTVLDPDSRLLVVVTIRADFLDRALQYADFGELLHHRLTLILPLTPDELTQAITRPLLSVGLKAEPELVSTIIDDVSGQPGALPLLQYALTELFDRRRGPVFDLDQYRTFGGVQGALARRAEEIYAALDGKMQVAARQIFLRLITLGEGTEDTRRRVLLTELDTLVRTRNLPAAREDLSGADGSGFPISRIKPLLDRFARYRLVTFDHDPDSREPTVEIAHEALLRAWARLAVWLEESRDDLRRQRILAAAAARWEKSGRDDSYLLRDNRLATFEEWHMETDVVLTAGELTYLAAGLTARDAQQAAEEIRRERELETARHLAREQTRRAEEQTAASRSLRRRAFLLGGALILALIFALTALNFGRSATTNANLAATNAADALAQRAEAQESERAAQEALSLSLAANARQALAAGDSDLALLLALASNNIDDPPEAARETLLEIAYAPAARRQFAFEGAVPTAFQPLPDGRTILVGLDNGKVQMRDLSSGDLLFTLAGHAGSINAIAITRDGQMALSGDSDGTAVLWDLSTGQIVHELEGHSDSVEAVAFLPGEKKSVTGVGGSNAPGELAIWDLENGRPLTRFGDSFEENREGIQSVAVYGDGRWALVGLGSSSSTNPLPILVWDLESEIIAWGLRSPNNASIRAAAVRADNRFALLGSADGTIYVLDLGSREFIRELRGHEGAVESVVFSPDGKTVVSGGLDDMVIWWDFETGRELHRFTDHTADVYQVGFLNERQIISASADGTLLLWDLFSNWEMDRWTFGPLKNPPAVSDMAFSPDGKALFVATGSSLRRVAYATGSSEYLTFDHTAHISGMAVSAGGQRLLTALGDGSIGLWDLTRNELLFQIRGHAAAVLDVDISADGERGLSASLDGQIFYWDLTTGTVLHRLTGHIVGTGVNYVRFLPGENAAISSGFDGLIVWDLETGSQVRRLTGFAGDAGSHFRSSPSTKNIHFAVASDGQNVLTTNQDQTMLLWDVASGRSLQRIRGDTDFLYEVEFLPNGEKAITTGQNQDLILWDITLAAPTRHYSRFDLRPSNSIPLVAIHPDGRTAVTARSDTPILKWRLEEPSPAELLIWIRENRVIRELTCLERQTFQIEPLCHDGTPMATMADLLDAVMAKSSPPLSGHTDTPAPTSAAVLTLEPRIIAPQTAVVGENRGDLARHEIDVWELEAEEGDTFVVEVIAEKPMHDFLPLPLSERFASGGLDTVLMITDPDGILLERVNDAIVTDGEPVTNARVDPFIVPADGVYRLEVRSFLDDHAGRYTLRITRRDPIGVDSDTLKTYSGQYLEGPWQYRVTISVVDDQLEMYIREMAQSFLLVPLGEREFLQAGDGSIVVFTLDEAGRVDGYELFVATIHPDNESKWFRADKVDN